ncbi:transmembrane protein 209 isoform X2 [Anabrus simplex]|uniref:transmembrane protein 209 isoform X2 n=1 Tax=Anabrus simplex TaxID=316456 RepID=UPI0035A26C58
MSLTTGRTVVRTPPAIITPVMDCSMKVSETMRKASQSLKWGTINVVLLAIVFYDISDPCPSYSKWIRYAEVGLAVVFAIGVIFHFCRYLWNTIGVQPVSLTPLQMKLLGIKKTDPYFKASTPVAKPPSPDATAELLSTTPMNLSAISWRSTSYLSSGRSDSMSPNYSMSAASWEYMPSSPMSTINYSGSLAHSPRSPVNASVLDQSNFSSISSVGVIEDEKSLNKYLQEFDEYEKSLEQPTTTTISTWRSSPSTTEADLTVPSRGYTYQLACPTPALNTASPGALTAEGGSPSSLKHKSLELWRRLGVKPSMLTQWNSNLRMWISQTVLERLVMEFDAVDEAFQRYGLTDMKLGSVGLERLKKTAQMAQVVHNIPTLPNLVPFLEASTNQEYIVARIRELAKGGCMSDFRWNSGGSLHGKVWEEHLPTDSALVMHLLATYLDTQLPPQPQNPDKRPFSSEYLVKYPEKPPTGKNSPIIQEVQVNPPHYVLIVGGEKFEVEMGRNNFFHTFLLFLYHLKTKEGGMLGRINLGPSGLNILWVINS